MTQIAPQRQNPPAAPENGMPLNLATFPTLVEKPLLMLPVECRPAVLAFWSMTKRLFPSCLEIATSFRVWMDHHGLQPQDVCEVCRVMTSPGLVAGFKFPADVTSELAQRVDRIITDRQRIAQQTAQRDREAREKQNALTPSEISSLIQSLSKGTNG